MPIHESQYGGEPALVYETKALLATVLPHVGGKVISLVDRATGRELLWRQPGRHLRRPVYGDAFDRYDISGWDECFPSIGPGQHPDAPWRDIAIPDHGELWAINWAAGLDGDDLVMRVDGVHFPYTFERRFRPAKHGLQVLYAATNNSAYPLRCFWSLHPFLAVTPTTRILLPDGVRVYVDLSKHARLGAPGTTHAWPVTRDVAGHEIDVSLMGPIDQDAIEKLFVLGLPRGWVAAFDEATDDYVALTFDHHQLPYVGLAINRRRWPDDKPAFSLILEPCSGWPDHLTEAVTRGACTTLPARGTLHWQVDIHVGRGRDNLQAALGQVT